MKFGGTSVADAERIKRAARRIVAAREQGHRVVAVLSARGKTTDELIAMAEEVSTDARPARDGHAALDRRAHLVRAVRDGHHDLGHRAISLTGSQAGIVTDTSHTKARILDVRADRIRAALDEDQIVLVAGFQGVSTARTSPRSAAAARTPPPSRWPRRSTPRCARSTPTWPACSPPTRARPDARKLPIVSFEEMLEMSASGAGVLQLRSVEYARNHGVRIHCRSSFTEEPVPSWWEKRRRWNAP